MSVRCEAYVGKATLDQYGVEIGSVVHETSEGFPEDRFAHDRPLEQSVGGGGEDEVADADRVEDVRIEE